MRVGFFGYRDYPSRIRLSTQAFTDDIKNLKNLVNPIGIGVGSLFVFKGKYKAVLINYPSPKEKLELCRSN